MIFNGVSHSLKNGTEWDTLFLTLTVLKKVYTIVVNTGVDLHF